ncbi:MAG: hypothetical protein J5924_05300 [Bacteroidaceae bacterium]|nr:hypothetical protein [Bacteroidaceae bacterium]
MKKYHQTTLRRTWCLLLAYMFAVQSFAQVQNLEENLLGKWFFSTTSMDTRFGIRTNAVLVGKFTYMENHTMEYDIDIETKVSDQNGEPVRLRWQMRGEANQWKIKKGNVIVQKLKRDKFEAYVAQGEESLSLSEYKVFTKAIEKILKCFCKGTVHNMTPSRMDVQFANFNYSWQRIYSEVSANGI